MRGDLFSHEIAEWMRTMFRAYVLSNLWDLVDLGVEESLDRVQALGADGVSVIVTSGPVAHLRAAKPAVPRLFRSRGGYFFQPAAEHYALTHAKPIVSSWLKSRNPLEHVVGACRARALELRVRISAFEVGRIAARHGDAASATVFGDVAPVALCPASPDVRGLLCGTVADLARTYGVATVELMDLRYHSGVLAGEGVEVGFDPGAAFMALLGICFSASSRQAAVERGVDAAAAARYAEVTLEEALCSGRGPDRALGALLEEADILRDYLASQRQTLDLLWATLGESPAPTLVPVVPPDADRLLPPVGTGPTGTLRIVTSGGADLAEDGGAGSGANAPGIEFDAATVATDQPAQLVSALKQAVDGGVTTVVLGHFGLWPESAFESVKQAIRFAKRAAS